jgi:CBS domain-containing protein
MAYVPVNLQNVVTQLKKGDSPQPETVRTFLRWFDAERRGFWIVRRIRNALDETGVTTEPDFESAYIDAKIEFRLRQPPPDESEDGEATAADPTPQIISSPVVSATVAPAVIGGAVSDPTYRIGKLASANKSPLGVTPDCTLKQAITLMLANDYSQLPVWQNERTVKGIISWASIGARLALDQPSKVVRECMEPAYEVSADDSLFAAIATIIQHQYVLVRGNDGRVTGIVTTSDLSFQFQQLAEPFLLLGEIENHIRRLIDGKFTSADLVSVRDPGDDDRPVTSVSDLTFGEYVRLLENPDNWSRVGHGVDRATFTKELDKIRVIRNDVMHFDPDGIGEEDLEALRRFVAFLQKLRDIGAA